MVLENFFTKDQVIKVKSAEKQHVFRELLEKLQELELIENKDRFYAQVVHRESLENTGIGNGLAIPHARTETIDSFVSILGICDEGIDYQGIDDKPVRYILLSIFPTKMSTKYLYLVGMMARIFSNTEIKERIDNENGPKRIYAILNKESKTYFENISEKTKENQEFKENAINLPSSDLDLLIRLDRLYQVQADGQSTPTVEKKINEIKKLIDNRSLTYYERMKKKRNNPFAILEKNSCSGCNMQIPPYYHKQIKEGNTISVCTHCGRFLIIV